MSAPGGAARLRSFAIGIAVPVSAIVISQLLVLVDKGEWLPWAVVTKAVVFAAPVALQAVGLVLLYRSSRIINFAQGAFGTLGAMLYLLLASVWEWSWWLAAPAGIAAAALAGVVFELFIARRFATAPRLVLTVVTIAFGQLLTALALFGPRLWGFVDKPGNNEDDPLPTFAPNTPFDGWKRRWFPETFTGDHLAVVVLALVAMAALALFFRYTKLGVAIRGSSENTDRASQLGINTGKLSTVVWVVAATLAALAAVLDAGAKGTSLQGTAVGAGGVALGAVPLLRALAAAVLGRMESMPMAIGAAAAISIFERAVFWAYGRTSYVDAAILLLVVGALLVQRRRLSRSDADVTGAWAASEELKAIPPELRDVAAVRVGVRRFAFVLAIVVIGYPWVMSPSQTNLGGLYAIYGIIGVSLVVLTGWGGQISLGQFAFVAVGAMLGGTMTAEWGVPFFIAVLVASVAGGLIAVLIGLPALRIRGLYLAVTTLAFAVATTTVLLNDSWFETFRPATVNRPKLFFIDTEDERAFYYLCLASLAFALFVAHGLRNTRTGRVLIAMRDNERAAQSFGVSLTRTRLWTFAVSGFLAAFAGALYAHHQHGVLQSSFLPSESLQMFLMAIIGGLGSVYGVLTGAVYMGTVTILVGGTAGQLLAGAGGVLLVLLFFPGGLGALAYSLRDVWLRRVALRLKIHVPSLMGERLRAEEIDLVPIAPRADESATVPNRYRVDSLIGTTGSSQRSKVWAE
jgi:branched-chain amino acid transport system permease protein